MRTTKVSRFLLASAAGLVPAVIVWIAGPAGASPAPLPATVQEAEGTRIELGAELYRSQCEPCHGSEGKGNGPAARFVDPPPRDLTAGEWMYAGEGTLTEVAAVIASGVDGTGMEPFDELLSEEEILALAAYVLATFTVEDR